MVATAKKESAARARARVKTWFSDHPLTQDRIADIQKLIDAKDPAILRTLTEDNKAFHDFKDRVHALPPGPKPKAATP